MPPDAPIADSHPFVQTSVARLMLARIMETHENCGISVISGPWGIGKTTAINAFAAQMEFQCAVIKVEPAVSRKGAGAIPVMKQVLEELRRINGRDTGIRLNNSQWGLRQEIREYLASAFSYPQDYDEGAWPNFTFIFDEAQYLAREAIEMLRYWNDTDRTTTPFPVALVFVGNNEFAMAESLGGESVLSGAVRSRLLFEEPLAYAHVNDTDLTLFLQSRGITDPAAISGIVAFYSPDKRVKRPAPKRDLRHVERMISIIRRRAGDGPITAAIVQSVLNP